MSEERKERCETCRFWTDVDEGVSDLGDCHRYPPKMAIELKGDACDVIKPRYGGWPLTFATDWCGEYQPTPTPATRTPLA